MIAEELGILFALEPSWTVSVNGKEFLHLRSSDIELQGPILRFGRLSRKVLEAHSMGSGAVRVRARARTRSQADVLVFYAGDKLPSTMELRRRRRLFIDNLGRAAAGYFGARVTRKTLHSDKQHGIGGAYPRLLLGATQAVLAVDPDESNAVVNGVMRAAIQWSALIKKRISVIVPAQRSSTIATRLHAIPALRAAFDWLAWDGEGIAPLRWDATPVETQVYPYVVPPVQEELSRIVAFAPDLLQAVPNIPARAVSVKFRGLTVAHVSEGETTYPLGPLEPLLETLKRERRHGSSHPLARAHEEAWLESNLIRQMRDILPVRADCIYPQVPSFTGEDRKIIDLLAVTDGGRLAVIEIKVTADPDLPFQALDYWLAVERHRKAGDFEANGYFRNVRLRDEPALLVMVAPLLAFHRTLDRLMAVLPAALPVMQIGINQAWKKDIKILRRKGTLG